MFISSYFYHRPSFSFSIIYRTVVRHCVVPTTIVAAVVVDAIWKRIRAVSIIYRQPVMQSIRTRCVTLSSTNDTIISYDSSFIFSSRFADAMRLPYAIEAPSARNMLMAPPPTYLALSATPTVMVPDVLPYPLPNCSIRDPNRNSATATPDSSQAYRVNAKRSEVEDEHYFLSSSLSV